MLDMKSFIGLTSNYLLQMYYYVYKNKGISRKYYMIVNLLLLFLW